MKLSQIVPPIRTRHLRDSEDDQIRLAYFKFGALLSAALTGAAELGLLTDIGDTFALRCIQYCSMLTCLICLYFAFRYHRLLTSEVETVELPKRQFIRSAVTTSLFFLIAMMCFFPFSRNLKIAMALTQPGAAFQGHTQEYYFYCALIFAIPIVLAIVFIGRQAITGNAYIKDPDNLYKNVSRNFRK